MNIDQLRSRFPHEDACREFFGSAMDLVANPGKEESFMNKFGERLQNLRTSRNLTVKDICFAVGIPQSRLNELEWGVRIPTRGQVERLAQYFDANAQELADLAKECEQAA